MHSAGRLCCAPLSGVTQKERRRHDRDACPRSDAARNVAAQRRTLQRLVARCRAKLRNSACDNFYERPDKESLLRHAWRHITKLDTAGHRSALLREEVMTKMPVLRPEPDSA